MSMFENPEMTQEEIRIKAIAIESDDDLSMFSHTPIFPLLEDRRLNARHLFAGDSEYTDFFYSSEEMIKKILNLNI